MKKMTPHVCLLAALLIVCLPSWAQQVNPEILKNLNSAVDFEEHLSPHQRNVLSPAFQNHLALAHQLLGDNVSDGGDPDEQQQELLFKQQRPLPPMTPFSSGNPHHPGLASVNLSALDFGLDRSTGFAQIISSSAWCGNNVVTGYTNTNSFLLTLAASDADNLTTGLSSLDLSYSHDGGHTFTELGFLTPGSNPTAQLFGNPSVACSSPDRFYNATLLQLDSPDSNGNLVANAAIGVSTSNDGGRTWGGPNPVAVSLTDFYDRPAISVDPVHPNHLYLAFTDITSPTDGPCVFGFLFQIAFTQSTDGGANWAPVQLLTTGCDPTLQGVAVTGAQVAADRNGRIYVAYSNFTLDANSNPIELIQSQVSTDGGKSFSQPVTVGSVLAPNGFGFLQGGVLDVQFPSLAVDSSREGQGAAYIAWSSGTDKNVVDLLSPDGQYHFSDVVLSKSIDGGNSWSAAQPVSPAGVGVNRDQFMPSIAVDRDGEVAVCYYDRRNDPANFTIDHYCSIARNSGSRFQDVRLSDRSSLPAHFLDGTLGRAIFDDFNTVTSEHTGRFDGFFHAFQIEDLDNPNLYGARF